MNDDPKAAWERYVAAWKAQNAEEKRRLYATCLSPGCTYTDPLIQTKGWAELEAYMMNFHEQIPGGHFVTEYFLAHHGRSIARWRMVAGDGTPLGEGISYGEYDEHARLTSMTGFFDTPPSPGTS